MKKNAKRTLAMLIALAICAAQLALPAAALENQEIQTVITIDGGSMTVTEKNETTTNGSTTTSTDTTIKEWSQGTEALSQDLGEDSSTTTVVGNETTVSIPGKGDFSQHSYVNGIHWVSPCSYVFGIAETFLT